MFQEILNKFVGEIDWAGLFQTIVTTKISAIDAILGIVVGLVSLKLGWFGIKKGFSLTAFLGRMAAIGTVKGAAAGGGLLAGLARRYYVISSGLGSILSGAGIAQFFTYQSKFHVEPALIGSSIFFGVFCIIYGTAVAIHKADKGQL